MLLSLNMLTLANSLMAYMVLESIVAATSIVKVFVDLTLSLDNCFWKVHLRMN